MISSARSETTIPSSSAYRCVPGVKITELAVRDVIHGRRVVNADAMANPQALELFRELKELKT